MFDRLNISFYGGSHEKRIGAIIEGIEIGSSFSYSNLKTLLKRRAASGLAFSTTRVEDDDVIFVSGIEQDGDTLLSTSNKIEFYIENKNVRDEDYKNISSTFRPSHADYTAYKKYGQIPNGGGKFSGRMTALICVIGSFAKDILLKEGITISSKIKMIGKEKENDSFGGIISCEIDGVKAGLLGDALFDGLEGKISYSVFSVPAVKGIEFGDGFELANMSGSESNDKLSIENGAITIQTNHMGGIDGGISNGNPITFNVVIKPTPSISIIQDSVDIEKKENVKISIQGRHDKCIATRALPCIESAAAIAILDELYKAKRQD